MKNDGRDIRHELSVKTRSKCRVEMHVSTKVAQTYLLVCGPVVSPVVRRLSCVFSSGVPGILHLTVTAHRKTADSRDITLWLMLFLRRSKVRSPGTKKRHFRPFRRPACGLFGKTCFASSLSLSC